MGFLEIILFFALHNWLYTYVTVRLLKIKDKEYVILSLLVFAGFLKNNATLSRHNNALKV